MQKVVVIKDYKYIQYFKGLPRRILKMVVINACSLDLIALYA